MADCIPAGMEAFVATDDEQFNVIKRVIDLCDYYVLIIGKRYGSINQKTNISYTEMEYDYAKEKGIPVLAFIMDDSAKVDESKIEHDPENIKKLEAFKNKARENRIVSMWSTTDELVGQLAIAIMRAKEEIPRQGWQRAQDFDEATLRREIMDLQKKNTEVLLKLENTKKELEELKEIHKPSDLVFENYKIKLNYRALSIDTTLEELFKIISTEMLGVAITEEKIAYAITLHFLPNAYDYKFNDRQFLKRILNQFRALNLLYYKFENGKLFWGLTPKGEVERDKLTLFRKT